MQPVERLLDGFCIQSRTISLTEEGRLGWVDGGRDHIFPSGEGGVLPGCDAADNQSWVEPPPATRSISTQLQAGETL